MGRTELEAWVGLDLVDMVLVPEVMVPGLEAMEDRLEADPLVVLEALRLMELELVLEV